MADEATIQMRLQIRKGVLNYSPPQDSFLDDVAIGKGPTPGAITVSTDGVDVDLSELTQPGYVKLTNLDETNYVTFGIYDPDGPYFYPLGELPPSGGRALFKFSRDLFDSWAGTGTAVGDSNNTFRLKANTAPCNVLVEAFDS